MKKIKTLFETPQKTAISVICIIAALAFLGAGTVFAASSIAENSSIGEENARNFAYVDAGVDPVTVEAYYTKFKYEQQQFVYEVKFTANGIKYAYLVRASDGAIVKKEMETIANDGTLATITAQITLDTAKETALNDAGLTIAQVTITKAELELEQNTSVYEIEFYTDNAKYEYEINAVTGLIYSKSKEAFAPEQKAPEQVAGSTQPDTDPSLPDTDAAQPGADAAQPGIGSTQPDTDPSLPDTGAAQPGIGSTQPDADPSLPDTGTAPSDNALISLDTAKSIALSDANVSSTEVTYTKTELYYEHGTPVYEIEFYTSAYKYEYEINAATGTILDKDAEAFNENDHHTNGHHANDGYTSGDTASYIGLENAKSIAVGHAGFSLSDVTFSKAKLDSDDGIAVYKVEFHVGKTEYEYKIDALSGAVLEYEVD